MTDRLRALFGTPVVAAPMGGGPSTPALVAAASAAGALGFLAGAYKDASGLKREMDAVKGLTDRPFGVNLFVPGTRTAYPEQTGAYVRSLAADAEAVGAPLAAADWDDDGFEDKVALLVREPPAVVTFTFGCPDREVLQACRAAGSIAGVTVTDGAEARVAVASGADVVVAQGYEAGGHRGTFRNDERALVGLTLAALLRALDGLPVPVIAAGGVADEAGVSAALASGAAAVACGTAFLRCPESGANATYRAALAAPRYSRTGITRAFSGRPARGLVNGFMEAHPDAPAAYPEINNATRPLRAAAAAGGDTERLHLWAGTGFRSAAERPAAEVVDRLTPRRAAGG